MRQNEKEGKSERREEAIPIETAQLNELKQIAKGIAATFGSNCEVVVHDVTGKGAASKEQVKEILERTMDVKLDIKYLDASDAIAIAMCHFYQLTNPMSDTKASTNWKNFVAAHADRVVKR